MATGDTQPASSVDVLLATVGGNRAALDADRLLARVLQCSLASLRAFPERRVSELQRTQWEELLSRRAAGEPYAYIVGEQEFWSLPLAVGPGVLVPRADSEVLVEAALERIDAEESGWVADVGTGSANLALALARERPQLTVLAVERSALALPWARRNIARHCPSRVGLVHGSGLEMVADGRFVAVISNPPYIAQGDPDLDPASASFEPAAALYAADAGMAMLSELAEEAMRVLRPGGWLLLEHGWKQGPAVADLLSRGGYAEVETCSDLAGRPRVSMGKKAP